MTARNAAARGIATPRIAPIAAGPAPSRKAARARVTTKAIEVGRAGEHECKRGRERDERGQQTTREARRRVADGCDGLDDRARRDLAERHCVQELRVRHPVVVVHRVGLHQRDDHEAAAVAERADLQRNPDEREGSTRRGGATSEQRRPRVGAKSVVPRSSLARELDGAAAEKDQHEPRTDDDSRGGDAARRHRTRPNGRGPSLASNSVGRDRYRRAPRRPRRQLPRRHRRRAPRSAATPRGRPQRDRESARVRGG